MKIERTNKIVLLSDVHLLSSNPIGRKDNLVYEQFVKLTEVLEYAALHETIVLQAGDLTDTPRSWFLISKLTQLLRLWNESTKFKGIKAVFGQHDTYMYSEETRDKTTLGVLADAGLVEVLKPDSPLRIEMPAFPVHIYGCSFGQEPIQVKVEDGVVKILVVHAPIYEGKLFPGHETKRASNYLEKYKCYDLILCGDIHRYFIGTFKVEGIHIVNTGPLLRKDADEYSFEHRPCFVTYDVNTRKLETHYVECKPAEEVLSRDHLVKEKEKKLFLDEFIKEFGNIENEPVSIVDVVGELMTKSKTLSHKAKTLLSEVMNAEA